MRKIGYLLLLFSSSLFCNDSGFEFYSGSLLFKPFVANTFEPRVGLIWRTNDKNLRLDIGNSIDLLQYKFQEEKRLLTIGFDFFTYTRLHGEKNFHFPVDAVDYLFGIHSNYIDSTSHGIWSARLRLSHISAHFVDGHFDGTLQKWKNDLSPRVYSKEFFDLGIAYEPNTNWRAYCGAAYVWHSDPTTLPKYAIYAGAENHFSLLKIFYPYIAYQFTVGGIIPRHEFQSGIKIGNWYGRGTQFFFRCYKGNSIHGEYYDREDNYSSIGFTIDF